MVRGTVAPNTDDAQFAALLQQHRAMLLRQLRRLCGADAEDVLQETLAKVWRLRRSYDAAQNGRAWLVRAALRTLHDHRLRRQREPRVVAQPVEPAIACSHRSLEIREEVARRLATLPPIERRLLVEFHSLGLTLRELATRHRLPLNTVKSHLHRARARLAAGRGGEE